MHMFAPKMTEFWHLSQWNSFWNLFLFFDKSNITSRYSNHWQRIGGHPVLMTWHIHICSPCTYFQQKYVIHVILIDCFYADMFLPLPAMNRGRSWNGRRNCVWKAISWSATARRCWLVHRWGGVWLGFLKKDAPWKFNMAKLMRCSVYNLVGFI